MKYLLKNIEQKLGKELKRKYLSFGIDIALKVTGFITLKTTNTKLIIVNKGIIDTSKMKTITDRLDCIEKSIYNIAFTKMLKSSVGVIEMPFVGFNRNTAIVLGLAAGVAYSTIKKKFPYCFFIRAATARNRIGLTQRKCSKKNVQEFIKTKFEFVEDNNIVDAFVLALVGLIK